MATDGEGATTPSSWIFWAMANVFGGLRSVVDLVWQWGQVPFRTFPMDTLNTLLLGWLVFGVFMVALAKFLYNKFLSGDQADEDAEPNEEGEDGGPRLPAEDCKGPPPVPPPPPVVTKKATIVPDALPAHVPAPIATGGDPDAVRWVNNLLVWFFEGAEGGPVVRDAWNDNLNDYTVGVALETGVLIEILEFLPQTTAPFLSNIIVDCSPNDDIIITCDMTITLYMRVQTTRTQRDVTTESLYACAVRPLRGRLNIALKTHKCIAFVKLDGWPEVSFDEPEEAIQVNLELEGIRNNAEGLNELQLQEVVKEELTAALRKVTLELDFSSKKTFPRFSRQRTLPDNVMPVGYDALASSQTSHSNAAPVGIVGLNGKRLLVKVVKATGVGGDAGVSSCYTVIEMDEPPQKFSTNVVKDTSSPFWDEQFLFDLNDNTLELLFELYDKGDERFVGLGIVGIEELVATPSQRQIIPLQARPYEKDQVSGSLTCEFLFLDRADLPDLTLRKTVTGQVVSGKMKTTTTTYVKPPEEKQGELETGVSTVGVAEAALKDLEEKQPNVQVAPNTRSTLIIHASKKVTRTPSGEYAELANGTQPPEEPREEDDEESEYYKPGVSITYGTGTGPQKGPITPLKSTGIVTAVPLPVTVTPAPVVPQHAVVESANLSPVSNGLDVDERGRSRTRRKRDFFGNLRRKFSRSKVRSKSVDPTAGNEVVVANINPSSVDTDALGGRSISMERSTSVARSRGKSAVSSPTSSESQTQRFLTVPMARGRSTPSGGIGSGDSGSTRSSLSGTSGLSSASTKTYINEASLLVVETLENGVIKHYLVPLSLQRKNKWRKKGTKLHIYNEHTFVAKHLSSSITCQVCQKGIGRRLGKQGYECRDCSFKCHKPCHVKTDLVCPNSTVNSMDLVYVKDEKAEKKKLNS